MKKLIALLLVVAFICASTVGCGTPTSPAAPKTTPGAGGGAAPGGGGAK